MKKIVRISVVLLALLIPGILSAQDNFRVNGNKSTVVVKGTSSLHDWEMDAMNLEGTVAITIENGTIQHITGGTLKIKPTDLKSHNSIMDNKAWDALKSEKYPTITFRITHVELKSVTAGKVSGTVTGNLSLAGVSRQLSSDFSGVLSTDKTLIINGKFNLDLPSYKIDPPTAMMGTLKTGKEVELDYNLNLQYDQQLSQNK